MKSSAQKQIEDNTVICVLIGGCCEYRSLVVVWSAIVDGLSWSPVGVAEQACLGPLEMTLRV